MTAINNELEFTSVTGECIVARVRADVACLGCREFQRSAYHAYDKDMRRFVGIDPMSFVLETPEDQMAAYAFSKHWVGRVW